MLRTYAFVLAVTDLDRSAAYYRDVLGFRLSWEDGGGWRLAERDGVRLMLGHCPNEKPATEIFPHDWFGYLETEAWTRYVRNLSGAARNARSREISRTACARSS
jgi:catechol 2,3-dioxygenase-like lactoylglutathione lyase family enzyme